MARKINAKMSTTGIQVVLADRLDAIFTAYENGETVLRSNESRPRTRAEMALQHADRLQFLRMSSLFGTLDDEHLERILAGGRYVQLKPGATLFEVGANCDAVLVVKSGVIEIVRAVDGSNSTAIVALLGQGDVLGEVGVLAGGVHRSSAVAPEGAQVLSISRSAFEDILASIPDFAVSYASMLAQRVIGTAQTLDRADARSRHLEGSLEFFDLGVLVQSFLGGDVRSGLLVLRDRRDRELGHLLFLDSLLVGARFKQLRGSEAFFEIFVEDPAQLRFSFDEIDDDEKAEILNPAEKVEFAGLTLLMEAARIRDEYSRCRSEFELEPSRYLSRRADELSWDDPNSEALAAAIWNLLSKKRTLAEIVDEQPCCQARTFAVLRAMIEVGLIG